MFCWKRGAVWSPLRHQPPFCYRIPLYFLSARCAPQDVDVPQLFIVLMCSVLLINLSGMHYGIIGGMQFPLLWHNSKGCWEICTALWERSLYSHPQGSLSSHAQ